MEDAGALVIALDDIAFIEDVAAVDVAPQSRTDIVVDVVAAEHDAVGERELQAAGLPAGIEAIDIVGPDLRVLDLDVLAGAGDAALAVVMQIGVPHPAAGADADRGTAVQAKLAVLHDPTRRPDALDRSLLGDARIFLDDEILDQDI